MKVKDALKWAGDDGWMVLSNNSIGYMSSDVMFFSGDFRDRTIAFKSSARHNVLENFGKANIIYSPDSEKKDVVMLTSLAKEMSVPVDKKELYPCSFIKLKLDTLFSFFISRSDFLGKTTHMKIGDGCFARGYVEEGKWRAAYKGTDSFCGWVYDMRVPNAILRDHPEHQESIQVYKPTIYGTDGPIGIVVCGVDVHISREMLDEVREN